MCHVLTKGYTQGASECSIILLADSSAENVTKLSFISERMQAAERPQLCRLLTADDFNRCRGVVNLASCQTLVHLQRPTLKQPCQHTNYTHQMKI